MVPFLPIGSDQTRGFRNFQKERSAQKDNRLDNRNDETQVFDEAKLQETTILARILANLDGTGSEDLIYLNGIEEEFQVLRADGEDGMPFGSMDHYDVDPDSTCLTVCDFNQNGVLDVAVSSNSTGLLRVFFGKDPEADFSRGDVNRDGALNLADPIVSLQSLFTGPVSGLCMDALDCDDNGTLDLSDPIVLLSFLFSGGQSLPYPFGFCDQDLTDDLLDCSLFQVNGDCP